jgi:exosortase
MHRLAFAPILALVVLVYARTFLKLSHDWWTDAGASYGILVPPIAVYVAYRCRRETLSIPARPEVRGLLVILAACLMFLVAMLGADLFLSRLSLVLLLAGLSWTFWGASRTKTLAFPLVLLVTMVPLPGLIYNRITLPLQLLSAQAATELLKFLGTPVLWNGDSLESAYATLSITGACSAFHSLDSLVAVSSLLGFIECRRPLSRALLPILCLPFAIGVSVIRLTGTMVLSGVEHEYATTFYHAFPGWLIFVAESGIFWAMAKVIHALVDQRMPG